MKITAVKSFIGLAQGWNGLSVTHTPAYYNVKLFTVTTSLTVRPLGAAVLAVSIAAGAVPTYL